MDKLLSIRSRSKSRERPEPKPQDIGAAALETDPPRSKSREQPEPKPEDIGAAALVTDPPVTNTNPNMKTDDTKETSYHIKTEKLPDDLFEHLMKDAEHLPYEDYGEIITHENGLPIYYFGGKTFQEATKAIWKVKDKIYALEPKRIKLSNEDYNVYENPDEKIKETGARPKQYLQRIDKQITEMSDKLQDVMNLVQESRAASRAASRVASRAHSRHQSPETRHESLIKRVQELSTPSRTESRQNSPERREPSKRREHNENWYNDNYNHTQNDSLEARFSKFLLKQGKIFNCITPLQNEDGASHAIWLHGLKLEMESFNIPSEFFVPLAIRKLPDKIRPTIVAKKIKTPKELEAALYSIYCGTKNATSLKSQFSKENKMAPNNRDYNALREQIKRTQVPIIVSVERIGQNDPPMIRDRLIEETSEMLSTELFLNAIQDDAKRSVLNKGRHESFDELVQRANDFASSISDDPKSKIGNITDKPYDNGQKCKIHPLGQHNQTECYLRCKIHPWGSHKNADCYQKNGKSKEQKKHSCPPERHGKHGETYWCLFCNTVTPKLEEHRCLHCWKCSTDKCAVLLKDCPCPSKFKKGQ